MTAADVGLLIPHGMGIASHDRAELAGLKTALGDELSRIPMAPIKSQMGNLAAGSGVDAATAVLALKNGTIPGAMNTATPIDGVTLNVAAKPRDLTGNVAISSVYSLGGQNAALVFKTV